MRLNRIAGCNDILQDHLTAAKEKLSHALQMFQPFTVEHYEVKNQMAQTYALLGEIQECFDIQQQVVVEEFCGARAANGKGGAK